MLKKSILNNKRHYILPRLCVSLVSDGRGANRSTGFCVTVHVLACLLSLHRCNTIVPGYPSVDRIQDGRGKPRERAARDISRVMKVQSKSEPVCIAYRPHVLFPRLLRRASHDWQLSASQLSLGGYGRGSSFIVLRRYPVSPSLLSSPFFFSFFLSSFPRATDTSGHL